MITTESVLSVPTWQPHTLLFIRWSKLDQIDVGAQLMVRAKPELKNSTQIMTAFTQAVTDWVREYAEGADAWSASVGDLNIGDLLQHNQSKDLERMLTNQGILVTSVLPLGTAEVIPYDRVLVSRDSVEAHD